MFDHFYDPEAFQKLSDRISTLISKLWLVIHPLENNSGQSQGKVSGQRRRKWGSGSF